MTLKQIAELAGVSVATASKAFAGSREISQETKARIFDVAKREGCFDKYNKNKFEKPIIAVLCPEVDSDYYNAIVAQMNREITACGAYMTVSVTNFSNEIGAEFFNYYASYAKADGIIIIGAHKKIKNPNRVPAVIIGNGLNIKNTSSLLTGFDNAINDAILHLKAHGHTKIGFIGETLTQGKLSIFKGAMRKAGLPIYEKYIYESSLRFEGAGMDAAEVMLSKSELPTDVVAAYDNIAIGFIKALKSRGIFVPRDISVIGMDDISVAPYLETSLSSIATKKKELCRAAVQLIMKKIENQYFDAPEPTCFLSEFIARDSSGPAPER